MVIVTCLPQKNHKASGASSANARNLKITWQLELEAANLLCHAIGNPEIRQTEESESVGGKLSPIETAIQVLIFEMAFTVQVVY
jgi:hypothetical protein